MKRYVVIYETSPEGGWNAWSPDVPGCYATGETRREAERRMARAIPDHIAVMREHGLDPPRPHHIAGTIAV